ncbi:MAG: hypothetical protein HYT94_01650 [Parcubacteria group bacterium]|nr:hypothetical protein [Parcubacteria group bacterium]
MQLTIAIGLMQADEIPVFPPERSRRSRTNQYCFPSRSGEKQEDRRLRKF